MWKKGSPAPTRPVDAPSRTLVAVAPLAALGAVGGVAVAALAAGIAGASPLPGVAGHGRSIFDRAQEQVKATYESLPIPFFHPPAIAARPAGAIAAPLRPYPMIASTIGAPPPPPAPPMGDESGVLGASDGDVHVVAPPAPRPTKGPSLAHGSARFQSTRASKGSVSPALPSRHSSKAGALSGASGPT